MRYCTRFDVRHSDICTPIVRPSIRRPSVVQILYCWTVCLYSDKTKCAHIARVCHVMILVFSMCIQIIIILANDTPLQNNTQLF